jgi:hypothetical protein
MNIVVDAAEVELISDRLRVGGRFDALLAGGRPIMTDWKTGGDLYASHLVQLAGYAILWEEFHPDHPIEGYFLGRFDKETGDWHAHEWTDLRDARAGFLMALRLWYLERDLTRRLR